jgi:hypothetical protein
MKVEPRLRLWSVWLTLVLSAGWSPGARAADSLDQLGNAFGPAGQANGAPTVEGSEGAGAGVAGVRVLVSSRSRSLAYVDGVLVHVGAQVNGMRVAAIDQQGLVLVNEDGVRSRLNVSTSAVKQARTTRDERKADKQDARGRNSRGASQ